MTEPIKASKKLLASLQGTGEGSEPESPVPGRGDAVVLASGEHEGAQGELLEARVDPLTGRTIHHVEVDGEYVLAEHVEAP